jgi:BirA family transcriptional regulator, biotin operon repressor / biotin---[acetyl-CoA-carboxylase] ligase
VTGFLARRQHLETVGSTNDVVRDWLAAGVPEVCLATADEQTGGRGRDGRSWIAPAEAGLLASLGFRPTWLAPDRVWQLAAVVSMAMTRACEDVASLPPGTVRLKWPNDLVVVGSGPDARVQKLAGVLGESDGLGTDTPRVVVGIGVNGDWPADSFPADLAGSMTSLQELAGQSIDHEAVLDGFLAELEPAIEALRAGAFDGETWSARQATTDREVELVDPGGASSTVRAVGVDPATGALLVADTAAPSGRRAIVAGEIRHVRLAPPARVGV